MTENILYIIGLILALLYLVMGFDDFLWDIFSLLKRSKYKKERLDFKVLRTEPPKLLAITIGAWDESGVIGQVIENLVASIQYPKSMYHLFVGVYPNDQATIDIVEEIEKKIPNVHMVINCLPGPTTKAQNINFVISQIKEYEKKHDWKFASITVHDAEDVVHPYELMVTNYLINQYDGLQFPVFPLMQMPRFTNFFSTMTVGTYADEFAENHFTTMVGRCSTGAFVPSAGTGFALSRKTIDSFETDEILPRDSLTEDYRLSLILAKKGLRIHYVLDLLPRVSNDNKIVHDYIVTRSMFPTTFKAAVKQKTRWILGITMQSIELKDVFAKSGLSLMERYSIYKDLKAKVGNMLAFIGYPVLVYFIMSLFIPLTPIYPFFSLSWYLSLVVTVMMIVRQISRAVAISNVYGFRSMFFACLLPPVLPLRIIWGNIINLTATTKAYLQSISGKKEQKKEQKEENKDEQKKNIIKDKSKKRTYAWSKTNHTFLPKEVLSRYHRTFGDVLIEKGITDPETLKKMLKEKPGNVQIGQYLLQRQIITNQQLLELLSHIKGIQFVDLDDFSKYDLPSLADVFDKELLTELKVLPVLCTYRTYVVAYCENTPNNAQSILRDKYGIQIVSAFTTADKVSKGIEIMYEKENWKFKGSPAYDLFRKGKISAEQYIIACNYAIAANKTPDDILDAIGLRTVEEKYKK